MVYADPARCPDCRASIEGARTCPSCGLDLTTPAAAALWQTLRAADAWVAQARAATIPTAPPPTAPAPAGPAPRVSPTADLPAAPPLAPRPVSASPSVGGLVLALGAILLVVAATIFVGVAWGSLGVGGRAGVLLLVTLAFGGLAAESTRRRLLASAEALWAVTLGLVTIDWFAAVALDLLGLSALSGQQAVLVWSLGVGALGAALVHVVTRLGVRELVVPSVVAGLLVWPFAVAVPATVDPDASLPAVVLAVTAFLAAALFSGALHLLRVRIGTWIALPATGVAGIVVVATAVVDATSHPSLDQLLRGHGLPLLFLALGLLGGAVAARRVPVTVTALAAGGALAVLLLVTIPAGDAWGVPGYLLPPALLAALGAWLVAGQGPWRLAGRVSVLVALAVVGALSLPGLGQALDVVGNATVDRDLSWGDAVGTSSLDAWWPWWTALVATGALVSVLLAARRWPGTTIVRPHLLRAVAWSVAVGVVAAVTAEDCSLLVLVLALAVGVVVPASLHLRTTGWRWVSLAAVALLPLAAVAPAGAALTLSVVSVLWLVVAAFAGMHRHAWTAVAAGGAVVWASVALVPFARLVELGDRPTALVWTALVAATLGVSLAVRRDLRRPALEVAAVLPALLAIEAATVSLGWSALVVTALGVVVTVIGTVTADRRPYVAAGAALLGVAYVLRLVASEVDVVEAYTVPFAVVLLAVGLWSVLRLGRSTEALLPGLLLGVLPSLTLALTAPTGLRALLVGLVGVALLAGGLAVRWRTPFLVGGFAVLVLALRNVGPEAWALPRWVVLAVVGAALLGVGVTWEARVRNGRAAVRFVAGMR